MNPYVVDVNHDGRADLLWTTVCMYGTGFDFTGCAVGDANQVLTGLAAPDGTFTLHALQSLGASGWTDFVALVGDVNGDGNPDLVFNSTCQKTNYIDFTCTVGAANLVYVALGDGNGGFTLGPLQTYETSGWDNFQVDMADVDGDGRRDLVWIERCQTQTCSGSGGSLVVRVGLARPDGTFAVTAPQDLGFGYWTNFRLSPGDVDGDGKADLIFYNVGGFRPLDSAAVYEFLSDGSGGFTPLPMQLLAGRGWHDAASGGYTLHVGDVTGDGKDDLVWLDTSPADHDRVIVSGDAAAITGTTTTTLPDCHALSGAAGVSCLCTAGLRLEECAAVTLPGRLTGGFEKACELLGKIPGASKRSQRRLRGHALARIAGLRRFVARRGIAKKLTQPCDAAVADRLSALRTDAHP
jgi:hypothetical protein